MPSTFVTLPKFRGLYFAAAVPPILVTAGYFYNLHDRRDIDDSEVLKARCSLERIDGRKILKGPLDSSTSSSGSSRDYPIVRRHIDNLESSGACLVRSVLSSKKTVHWDDIVSRQLFKDGACIIPAGGSIGRVHCPLAKRDRRGRGDGLFEELAEVADTANSTKEGSVTLKDIAKEYFASHGISEGHYRMAQLQLLDASPKSMNQVWHRDNVKPGLTALIALQDVGANGPTEILLRSHHSSSSVLSKDSSKGKDTELPRILLAAIKAGDAIVYDARVLHRGRGYGNVKEISDHRPVLVIRWDADSSPAPGTGIAGTQLSKWQGEALAFASTVLDWLS